MDTSSIRTVISRRTPVGIVTVTCTGCWRILGIVGLNHISIVEMGVLRVRRVVSKDIRRVRKKSFVLSTISSTLCTSDVRVLLGISMLGRAVAMGSGSNVGAVLSSHAIHGKGDLCVGLFSMIHFASSRRGLRGSDSPLM